MKKILISGGAGFLGSHLCNALIAKGFYVYCMDNFHTGTQQNINHLFKNNSFKLITHDITSPYVAELKIDQIYNLACPASPVHYQHDPVKTLRTNVHGSINMLELARKNNSRILQASTSEIYGDPEVHPQTESYWGRVNPIGPRSCYDEGKRCAETLFSDYHRQYNLDTKIVRIFNTYGPNMHPNDGRVVSNFIVQALKGDNISIYGDGSQTRSFCYVDDMIKAFVSMMDSDQAFHGPVNLGNPVEFSMSELAELVLKLTHSKSKLIFKELPIDDPKQRKPDISLAIDKLNWMPEVSLDDGLAKTIKYFKKILS